MESLPYIVPDKKHTWMGGVVNPVLASEPHFSDHKSSHRMARPYVDVGYNTESFDDEEIPALPEKARLAAQKVAMNAPYGHSVSSHKASKTQSRVLPKPEDHPKLRAFLEQDESTSDTKSVKTFHSGSDDQAPERKDKVSHSSVDLNYQEEEFDRFVKNLPGEVTPSKPPLGTNL